MKIFVTTIFSWFFLSYFFCKTNAQEFHSGYDLKINRVDSTGATGMVYHISPDLDYIYKKPRPFLFITNFPKDIGIYCKDTFQKKNALKIAAMISVTGLLIAVDQPIVDEAKRIGKRINISAEDKTKTIIHVSDVPILYVPTNFGSGLYYLGDGYTYFFLTGAFLGYGLIRNDNRALQTSSQLAEGLATIGVVIQTLKHITGRQSPIRATAPGGVWRPFPNQLDYIKHVPAYDAFPSGHLATAMMAVTVIADNYPEHKYIKPLGYTLMGLLAFQMLNNGVHWASDYPLALAIGYSFGKIAVARSGRFIVKRGTLESPGDSHPLRAWNLCPTIIGRDGLGISLQYILQ